jgi:hypothetical protein
MTLELLISIISIETFVSPFMKIYDHFESYPFHLFHYNLASYATTDC